jgi:hypothetical protein
MEKNMIEPICTCWLCKELVVDGQRWEYKKAYPDSVPEWQRERIHKDCFRALLKDVIKLYGQVPEDQRGDDDE